MGHAGRSPRPSGLDEHLEPGPCRRSPRQPPAQPRSTHCPQSSRLRWSCRPRSARKQRRRPRERRGFTDRRAASPVQARPARDRLGALLRAQARPPDEPPHFDPVSPSRSDLTLGGTGVRRGPLAALGGGRTPWAAATRPARRWRPDRRQPTTDAPRTPTSARMSRRHRLDGGGGRSWLRSRRYRRLQRLGKVPRTRKLFGELHRRLHLVRRHAAPQLRTMSCGRIFA